MNQTYDLAVIGDGFCSLMLCAQLQKTGKERRVAVIGDQSRWGKGVAYGRCGPHHLLNVPAARMGAYPDRPDDFLNWVLKHKQQQEWGIYATDRDELARVFLPRAWYGNYLESIAQSLLARADNSAFRFDFFAGRAEHIEFQDRQFHIETGSGRLNASKVILATGVPETVKTGGDPHEFMIDPWQGDLVKLAASEGPVVILGTGLTMIDMIVSLHRQGYKGDIAAVSRRGLTPRPHADAAPPLKEDLKKSFHEIKGGLREKIRAFRANLKICVDHDLPWTVYFDHIRPHTAALWQGLSAMEQKRFIARMLPYWNIHRHRQPPSTFELLDALYQEGRLRFHKGRVRWERGQILSAHFEDGSPYHDVQGVVNARGPDYSYAENGLLRNMTRRGHIKSSPNGIGLEIDENFRAVGNAEGLYILGCPTAGRFLESTAVPELRAQCAILAQNPGI